MAVILCLETATTNCSVSVSNNGKVISLKEDYNDKYSHSERLHCYIDEVISESNMTLEDLDAIAVSKGPGSFTGLRIGVSAAKGLCVSLEIPLISVNTLESLAHQVKDKNHTIIPMLDARRMEVYSAVFSGNKKQIRETKAEILGPNSFSEYNIDENVYYIGNGVGKFKDLCTDKNSTFLEDNLPSAKEMAKLAEVRYLKKKFEDVAYFEPYYLKDFILG